MHHNQLPMEALMNNVSKTALLAFAIGLAACGESAVGPKSQAPSAPSSPAAVGGGSNATLTGFDTIRFSIVIDPARATYYNLGAGNSISFPAGSLCDPSKSTYGVGEWDKACTLATAPLTVNAIAWLDSTNHPHIDFNPSVRFVPSADPAGWVTISFTDYYASWMSSSAIGYCRNLSATCVDESKFDPTMTTVRDAITGRLTRRIKHFSGYNVFSGRDDDGGAGGSMSVSPSSVGSAKLPSRNP
jgi:hypothetical protein